MRIRLKEPIIGYMQDEERTPRVHADKGDILQVIFHNPTHFICDSKHYPGCEIPVFNGQCNILDRAGEDIIEDPHADEKFYHVYSDYDSTKIDDPFHTAFEHDDPE